MTTWGTKGIVEFASFANMTSESHVIITSIARGDSATWDQIAASDYTEVSNQPAPAPSPGPSPGPTPTPTRRFLNIAVAAFEVYQRNPKLVDGLLSRLEAEAAVWPKQ